MIYADTDMHVKLIDLKELTGKTGIPEELNDYDITSTICDRCMPAYRQQNGIDEYKR